MREKKSFADIGDGAGRHTWIEGKGDVFLAPVGQLLLERDTVVFETLACCLDVVDRESTGYISIGKHGEQYKNHMCPKRILEIPC